MHKQGDRIESARLADMVWLPKRQAACHAGCSVRYFDMYIRPYISAYQPNPGFGNKLLFRRNEIDEFLMSRKTGIQFSVKI